MTAISDNSSDPYGLERSILAKIADSDGGSIILNPTGFPHIWFEDTGPAGRVYDVLAVRGTFDFPRQGKTLAPAEWQTPILWGDELVGPEGGSDPLRMVIRHEGDTALYKPRADLLITGSAHSVGGKPRTWWEARVSVVGASGKTLHKKALGLRGPYRFKRDFFGWKFIGAETTTEVPLDYRYAFGGSFIAPAEDGEEALCAVYKPDNPAGCGWLPDAGALRRLGKRAREHVRAQIDARREMPAPQIEAPWRKVSAPDNRLAAQGFGPVARWCEPRSRLAGTYDAKWRNQRYLQLPGDFDLAFYQSAHPDMILPAHLKGDETIILEGFLPEGDCVLRLPALHVLGVVTRASGKKSAGQLVLDTVRIDLDARQVVLVWRVTFDRIDPVREIALGAMVARRKKA